MANNTMGFGCGTSCIAGRRSPRERAKEKDRSSSRPFSKLYLLFMADPPILIMLPWNHRHEGELIQMIVTKVSRESKKARLCVDNLVGIDNHVKAVMRMLSIEAPDVSQLVANLLRGDRPNFAITDEGIHVLKRRFREMKVLIILDDVDSVDQLKALAAELDWFGRGSIIIITTRNKDALNVLQEHKVYEVTEMDKDQALQLLSKQELRRYAPTAGLRALSEEIVNGTGGLPLALKVIGSFLHGKKTDIEVFRLLSLIKIGENDMLGMHDQLRDLGRRIVREENPKEPGKRSRLWGNEAVDVLLNYQIKDIEFFTYRDRKIWKPFDWNIRLGWRTAVSHRNSLGSYQS
ncbi:hypothetical protein CRG98_047504 [Punica granatum]|uniref:Uncharacterized protein n=1 Tax=Punica granatum TaxID=22663 RepID=A0A2I0HK78_PUNGR|nr:hypothetical protein CRG98_047504 [Punica granatum]